MGQTASDFYEVIGNQAMMQKLDRLATFTQTTDFQKWTKDNWQRFDVLLEEGKAEEFKLKLQEFHVVWSVAKKEIKENQDAHLLHQWSEAWAPVSDMLYSEVPAGDAKGQTTVTEVKNEVSEWLAEKRRRQQDAEEKKQKERNEQIEKLYDTVVEDLNLWKEMAQSEIAHWLADDVKRYRVEWSRSHPDEEFDPKIMNKEFVKSQILLCRNRVEEVRANRFISLTKEQVEELLHACQ